MAYKARDGERGRGQGGQQEERKKKREPRAPHGVAAAPGGGSTCYNMYSGGAIIYKRKSGPRRRDGRVREDRRGRDAANGFSLKRLPAGRAFGRWLGVARRGVVRAGHGE